MAAVVLTVVISFLVGSSTWLALGSKLPLNEDKEVNEVLNLVVYIGIVLVPVFFGVFYLLDRN